MLIVINKIIYCLCLTPFVIKFNKEISSIKEIQTLDIIPIGNSDNIILFVNKRTLFHIIYSHASNSVEYIKTELNNFWDSFVENDLLVVVKKDVSIFKLNNKEMTLIMKIKDNIKFIKITPDCQYLALFNEKILKFFRINDQKLLAELSILSSVSSMNINNKYISLGIEDNIIILECCEIYVRWIHVSYSISYILPFIIV